ncbi:MAG: M23 family metallopeptidase [Oligoflexales bacterium]|nr:M23 family metallopeptidase [Oligoflexales bacterium]
MTARTILLMKSVFIFVYFLDVNITVLAQTCETVIVKDLERTETLNIRPYPNTTLPAKAVLFNNMRLSIVEIENNGQMITNGGVSSRTWYLIEYLDNEKNINRGWISGVYADCLGANNYKSLHEIKAGNCNYNSHPAIDKLTWPVPHTTYITGELWDPTPAGASKYFCETHKGVDISDATDHKKIKGKPYLSVADGKVVYVGDLRWAQHISIYWAGDYGVIVDHGDNFYSVYGHGESAKVETGECVQAGQQLGTIGSEGNSTGSHLHFEFHLGKSFLTNAAETKVPFDWQDANCKEELRKYLLNPLEYWSY